MIRNLDDYWRHVEKHTDDPLFKERRLHFKIGYHNGRAAVIGSRALLNPYVSSQAGYWGWQKAIKEGKQ